MQPTWKTYLLWTVGGAAIALAFIFIVLHLNGCTPPAKAPVKELPCLPDVLKLEEESANCTEAQLKLDVLLRYSDTCRKLYPDGGLNVCAELDGGRHD